MQLGPVNQGRHCSCPPTLQVKCPGHGPSVVVVVGVVVGAGVVVVVVVLVVVGAGVVVVVVVAMTNR